MCKLIKRIDNLKTKHQYIKFSILVYGAEEMSQPLKVLATLAEDTHP